VFLLRILQLQIFERWHLNLVLKAGTNSEKLMLHSPNINASQFALDFDFYFEAGDGNTLLSVGFPSLGNGANCDVMISLEEQTWSIGLSDGTVLRSSGKTDESLKGQWTHLQVVFFRRSGCGLLEWQTPGHAEGISHLGIKTGLLPKPEGRRKFRSTT